MLTSSLSALDYSDLVIADPPELSSLSQTIKIALMADAATQQFVPILTALLARSGIYARIYEAGFASIEIEAHNPASGMYRFGPEVVVVLNCLQVLRAQFAIRKGDASEFVQETLNRIIAVWNQIQSNSKAVIIQSTFALPYERTFGNFDLKVTQSLYSVAGALNAQIAAAAQKRSGVMINDVEFVASWVGRRTFFDDRYWDLWKSFCALEHLPYIAQNIADTVVALSGRAVKCVICDLDNTLWGGVIGDDGVDGIRLNAHGDGEAHYRLQLFLKELRRRGILLAVCSKNEESNAKAPFLEHPDCVLKLSDFASFVANWGDKAHNIRRIQEELNIGFDSMVFIDDNPFERSLVRDVVPDVLVPELPEDPSEYVRFLSELNLFETSSFSAEDMERSGMYTREAQRRQAAAEFASVEEFMQSLNMILEMARFDDFHIPRISQLFQRSNQFNLNTRRHSESACAAMMRAPEIYPIYAKLSDRLGDHGLIGIVVLELTDGELAIRDWLMSCRVLARGVEQQMMNQVFLLALRLKASRVTGRYIPTAKNAMVRDFFPNFGFRRDAKDGGKAGATYWQLELAEYVEQPTFITVAMNLEEIECPSITTR